MPLPDSLSQHWGFIQDFLIPELEKPLGPLGPRYGRFIAVVELARVEEFVRPCHRRGRPLEDRACLARAFVAKAVFGLQTTRELVERLVHDPTLRRLCGWTFWREVPSESTFSRAFAAFAATELPALAHEALVGRTLGRRSLHEGQGEPGPDTVVLHVSRDSTPIAARERPARKPPSESKRKRRRRGRPRRGEEAAPKPASRLRRQLGTVLPDMIEDLPKRCDVGCKLDSKGRMRSWTGYKLHLDTADGGVPVSGIVTSASVHDSQAAIPLAETTARRVTNLYDLMDSAYDADEIRAHSRSLGHVPIIDRNPRRDPELKREIRDEARARRAAGHVPAEAVRYNARSAAERSNARLKDEFGGRSVRVRGHSKVACHLMFGILALAADQLMRRLN